MDDAERVTTPRWFLHTLGAVALLALAVRIVYILQWRHGLPLGGDSRYYHEAANLLADGKGFVEPYLYLDAGKTVQAADHPPAYIVYLAGFSLIGLDGATAHMLASAVLGVVTVVLIGVIARRLAGPRAGLVAAGIASIYPNLWSYDGALESETAAQFAVALCLLAAYSWWRVPERRTAVLLGAAIALAALSRAETVLLAVLLVVPLAVFRDELTRRDRLRTIAASWVAIAVLLAPWCIYNLTRFDRPTLLSTGLGPALQSSACDDAYEGAFIGYWSRQCVLDAIERSGLPADADRSQLERVQRDSALMYVRGHLDRLPVVVAARIGRTTGLWNVRQQAELDFFLGGRERWVAWSAWWSFYGVSLAAVAGAVLLRRRRVPVFPLLSFVVLVLLTVSVFFGFVRYRAVAEVPLVILAAVAIDAVAAAVRRDRSASMATA